MLYLLFFVVVKESFAIITHLNDTEYRRMPPLFELDDYDTCLRKSNSLYCLARLDLFADSPNDLITMIKEYSEYTERHYNHSYIERGVCVAKQCQKYINHTNSNTLNLNGGIEACLNQTIWNNYGLQAKLAHIFYCNQKDEIIEYDWSDWFFGGILVVLVSINIIGSCCDFMLEKYFHNKERDKYINGICNIILCFSLRRNWECLSSIKVKDSRLARLKGLHGLRALISFFIPLAHVMWLIGTGFTDNPQEFEKGSESSHYQLIFNGMMIVQIFFVMSGFLMVYNLEILSETVPITWSMWPTIFINRFWRLTPANALMILFTATWLRYLGSGPLWKLYVSGVVSDCRQYWWAHIFYINNYVPDDKACAVHTWHLATDMQLFVLGSIMYVATKSRERGFVISLLLLFSMAAPALHVWFQDLDALVLLKPEFYRSFWNDTYRYLHVFGHNNLSCFIIGMVTGYFAYNWQKNHVEVFKHKIWQYLTWCVIPGTVGLILTGSVFYSERRLSLLIRMAYAATHRAILGVITAFIILGLVFKIELVDRIMDRLPMEYVDTSVVQHLVNVPLADQHWHKPDKQRRVLECDCWVVLSKLSYCAYLLHLNMVHILLGARTQLGHVSFFYVIINHLGILTLSYLAAIPLFLMVEIPFNRLIKTLFQDTMVTNKKKL